ncbi:unnamed protein product, partial [Brassica oleracea]
MEAEKKAHAKNLDLTLRPKFMTPEEMMSKAPSRFNGASQKSVGTVRLPTYVDGVTMDTNFTTIDSHDIYNIILGRPWIH